MEIPIRLSYIFLFITLTKAENYILPDYIIPTRYILDFHVNPESDTFNGYASIIFDSIEHTNELLLHASPGHIDIITVILYEDECNVTSTNKITEIITITCSENFSSTDNLITILYQGTYSNDGRGIFKTYYQENEIVRTAVATQMEATFARRVFPCLDEPKFKALFDITVTHPETYTAISNGIQVDQYEMPE